MLRQNNPPLESYLDPNSATSENCLFCRYEALDNTFALLPHICTYLDNSIDDRSISAHSRGEAVRLLKSLRSFDFIVALTIGSLVIGSTNDLCQQLQGKDFIIFYQIDHIIEHNTCLLLEIRLNKHYIGPFK